MAEASIGLSRSADPQPVARRLRAQWIITDGTANAMSWLQSGNDLAESDIVPVDILCAELATTVWLIA
jgi:hypothetical protein